MEITIEYTDDLIGTITRRFLLRSFGWKRLVSASVVILGALYLISLGSHDWVFGVAITCLVILIVVVPTRYIMAYYRSMSAFRRLSSRTTTFTFTEEGLSTKTDLGASFLKWRVTQKVCQFPEAWLIFLTSRQYFLLPIQQVDATTRQFILAHVGEPSSN